MVNLPLARLKLTKEDIIISLIQDFEADFL